MTTVGDILRMYKMAGVEIHIMGVDVAGHEQEPVEIEKGSAASWSDFIRGYSDNIDLRLELGALKYSLVVSKRKKSDRMPL
jgi:hypothetical protein